MWWSALGCGGASDVVYRGGCWSVVECDSVLRNVAECGGVWWSAVKLVVECSRAY